LAKQKIKYGLARRSALKMTISENRQKSNRKKNNPRLSETKQVLSSERPGFGRG